ncbi:hypothetical protein BO71DRAFT_39738 [Aspergillus ellipticus CBS 707.79]|uniref:Uncharacterized protein n=1 Tax=Aspergillus ellipticus CBS 707.79 TaxID=1448320 RepID=A0A319DBQ5_9EURO|nr:hypothetical protein BO71DRAFT_39738 [Aspergillus ellipticus CBS 707.79]
MVRYESKRATRKTGKEINPPRSKQTRPDRTPRGKKKKRNTIGIGKPWHMMCSRGVIPDSFDRPNQTPLSIDHINSGGWEVMMSVCMGEMNPNQYAGGGDRERIRRRRWGWW